MANLPLTIADFAIARQRAYEVWVAERRPDPDERPTTVRDCIEHGMQELRQIRGTERLPRGVPALRERIRKTLVIAAKREADRDRWATNDSHTPPPDRRAQLNRAQRWLLALSQRFTNTYLRHDLDTSYGYRGDATIRRRQIERCDRDRDPGMVLYYGTLTARVRITEYLTAQRAGISVINHTLGNLMRERGTLILGARRCDAFRLPIGMTAVYDVDYVEPCDKRPTNHYNNHHYKTRQGVVIVPEDHPPHFAHNREAEIYGVLCAAAKLPAYRRARRKA